MTSLEPDSTENRAVIRLGGGRLPIGFVELVQAPTRVCYEESKFFRYAGLALWVGPPPRRRGGGLYYRPHAGGGRQPYAGLPATQRDAPHS